MERRGAEVIESAPRVRDTRARDRAEGPPGLLARYVPQSAVGSAAAATALVVPVGALAAVAGVEALGNYGRVLQHVKALSESAPGGEQ